MEARNGWRNHRITITLTLLRTPSKATLRIEAAVFATASARGSPSARLRPSEELTVLAGSVVERDYLLSAVCVAVARANAIRTLSFVAR